MLPKTVFLLLAISPAVTGQNDSSRRAEYRHREERLREHLLANYSRNFAPHSDPQVPLQITVQFALAAILDLNAANQMLSTLAYVAVNWADLDLTWDSGEVGSPWEGIDVLHFPPEDIWTPTLLIVNNAEDSQKLRGFDTVNLWRGGTVDAHVAIQLHTTCKINVERYPLDTQICQVMFAPLFGSNINLTGSVLGLPLQQHFDVSGEWSVENITVSRRQILAPEFLDDYTFVEFSLHLKRRPYFYMVTVLFPMVILSVTGACGFLLPLQCGEKVSFQVAIMVSLAVFLSFINEAMPKTSSSISRLAIYVDILLTQSCLAFLATLTVLRGHFHIEKIEQEDKERRLMSKEPGAPAMARPVTTTDPPSGWLAVKSRWRRVSAWVKRIVRRWYCCCCCIHPQSLDIFFFVVFMGTAMGAPLILWF